MSGTINASKKKALTRKSFSRIKSVLPMPNLLDVQLHSYADFIQEDVPPEKRELKGLEAAFRNIFPIEDTHGNYLLEYKYYTIGKPRYIIKECLERGVSYTVPLKVRLILHLTEEGGVKGEYSASIEQDIFFGNIPYMTDRGTFVINGAERVIVSQLQRSPGVFFEENIHPNGKKLYSARIIPFRGSWVDFTTDINDIIYAVIDRRKKFPVSILLRAIGYSTNDQILKALQIVDEFDVHSEYDKIAGRTLMHDVINKETGEVVFEKGHKLLKKDRSTLKKAGIRSLFFLREGKELDLELMLKTFEKDKDTSTEEEALEFLYKNLRAGDPPNLETAQKFVERLFFSPKKYDLGAVGRYRINKKFNLDIPLDHTVLTHQDILHIVQRLISMRKGELGSDDIDHLGNRRVRTVGEQLTNQFTVALTRMARTIKERMNLRESESLTPQDLVNSRIITSVINSFFGTNQLSQFMDQTNPLAEITHKRRVSALGPGGLTRERAGFEVRDVHYTHYGRLCPIETPEGPNIGLISSLATYAVVNKLGFIETPYRVIQKKNSNAKVTSEIHYLSADDEDRHLIAQANAPIDRKGFFQRERIRSRLRGDFPLTRPEQLDYMDVSPTQIVSVAASLIPFLEHDDANRALMGSNMQRQSVPLLRPERPIVGTGMEKIVARDSKTTVVSEYDGIVRDVSADHISIEIQEERDITKLDQREGLVTYYLAKFQRTNQDTTINQRPLVSVGQKVKKGDVIADGCATDHGELALGRNVLVAFMPWRGYNFEDAIVISERLVKDDVFTSVHIKEFELEVRDTKRGEEELTREIPNVSEETTKNLDENGIIRVGAEVTANDILIGKVTPKGETDPTPEEKLLRAIFGEKAGDVKDASKRCDPGVNGVVVDTKLFTRKGKESKKIERQKIEKLQAEARNRRKNLRALRDSRIKELLIGQISTGIRDIATGRTLIKAKTILTEENLKGYDFDDFSLEEPWTENEDVNQKITLIFENYRRILREIDEDVERAIFKIKVGDELQPGVLRLAKVFIASKRKISVGDKMAGRHGNKGVVATIVPEEDMPFLEDGTPVDIVLNPLGVPSRMNLGQLYETMLGWAGQALGVYYETPVFDGASLEEIQEELRKAGLPEDGKTSLVDGRTGEKFDSRAAVGYIYMMKLAHQVDDKMHARSTGPYSLITQQPLGGKAQFGGQRFGEMEVWALEAYGAAHILQEMLTIKSDDVEGRSKVFNAIVKGENFPEYGMPESFNVLLKELQGLGLEVELNKDSQRLEEDK